MRDVSVTLEVNVLEMYLRNASAYASLKTDVLKTFLA